MTFKKRLDRFPRKAPASEMPFINIPAAYAADPADVWTPKSFFAGSDPFAIVIRVQASSDLVKAGLSYNAVLQMGTPRLDPLHRWFVTTGNSALTLPTKDIHVDNQPFRFDNFAYRVWWDRYSDAVREIRGPEKDRGLFYVRGQIDVIGTNLFAHSSDFWYKAVP